jgi:hypothetical protein
MLAFSGMAGTRISADISQNAAATRAAKAPKALTHCKDVILPSSSDGAAGSGEMAAGPEAPRFRSPSTSETNRRLARWGNSRPPISPSPVLGRLSRA